MDSETPPVEFVLSEWLHRRFLFRPRRASKTHQQESANSLTLSNEFEHAVGCAAEADTVVDVDEWERHRRDANSLNSKSENIAVNVQWLELDFRTVELNAPLLNIRLKNGVSAAIKVSKFCILLINQQFRNRSEFELTNIYLILP